MIGRDKGGLRGMTMGKNIWSRLGRLALVTALGYAILLYLVPLFFPLPEGLENAPPRGQLFLDREGKPIRRLLDGDLRADEPATFSEFPSSLIHATIAAEDSRFFSHNGIDYLGLLRATRDALLHRKFTSGASTITQQTIKLYSSPRRREIRTKLIEVFSARRLEIFEDKETILTAYLNHLPYGNQFTGVRAAARGYFGKPLADLSIAESALLAGLPNKPSRLNPWNNLEGAKKRQLWILGRMKEEQFITGTEFAAALIEQLKFLPGPAQVFHAPHFTELARSQAAEAIARATESGKPVQTTLDLTLQQSVESTVSAELSRLAHQTGEANDLQSAVVVIENRSGDILALSGSRSYFGSSAGQINGAWQPRSAGSTLKPFTYLLALERGTTAATVLADTPIEYVTSTGVYQPVNFDRRFQGPVSVRHALANSLNVPAVKLLDEIGGPTLLHRCLAESLHCTSLAPEATEYGLGLTLGNAEVRLLELTNAYATLARLGVFRPYRFLLDPNRVESPVQQGLIAGETRVFDPDCAWLIADILSDGQARAAAFGLNSPLSFPFRVAAKTGTSTDFRDSWTVGFTPEFTVGVWVGRFNNRPLNRVSGSMGAAPIFHQIMMRLHRGREDTWYDKPSNIKELTVDRLSGKQIPEGISLSPSRVNQEWFVGNRTPPLAPAADYDGSSRTRLSLTYSNWWRSDANQLQHDAFLEIPTSAKTQVNFRIVSPLEGTVAFLDPDLPQNGARFPLKIAGSGQEEIEWSSLSLSVERKGALSWLLLEPGEHKVVAHDRKSGRETSATFTVRKL